MTIQNLSEQECIAAIEQGETFHADVADGAFTIKIESDAPFICTAIHDGHHMRGEIVGNCALADEERLYEEDPFTGEILSTMPITVVAHDSRYEYDLNRPLHAAVYEEAWGKVVWNVPLTDEQKTESLNKHKTFYRVLGALYGRVENQHGACLVYDVHSFNYKRMENPDVPAFNVGTEQLNKEKWSEVIDHWVQTLGAISLPGHDIRAAADEVFYGRGNQATFAKNFDNTLVLPTELKKIFMDELSGEVDSAVLPELKNQFEAAINNNVSYFSGLYLKNK